MTRLQGIFPAAFIFLIPAAANAACPVDTFLSCPVSGGKHLEVCIGPDSFTYEFGAMGSPELSLSVPMSAGTVTPWPGVGRAIWSSVRFSNEGYDYEAWHSVDRLEEDAGIEGGVNVLQGERLVTSLECGGGVIAPMFTLEDAMEAVGYCWNLGNHRWQGGRCH